MSVAAKKLVKRFGLRAEVAAVNSVSFEAPQGRITALLGPSGSGKSTLLRLVAGLESPDSGTIAIEGEDTTKIPVRERRVGFVFQNYALFGHMTAGENVAFGLKVRHAPKTQIAARVKELFELVQLDGMEKRYPSELSGGQRQRVALARALAVSPRVLLLDEPFGALDVQVRQELRSWLRTLHEQTRVTTLLVTHDREEAFELADHVVLLSKGEVAQEGPPTELYDRPANAFVASFLGGAREISRAVEAPPGERSFVRPTDLRVKKAGPSPSAPVGKIERVVRVGGFAKIWIALDSGDALTVQMSSTELDELGVGIGEAVEVEVREARTFVNDYSI